MNIYGASGHGMVVFDILSSKSIAVHQIFDDDPKVTKFLQFKVVHCPDSKMITIPTILAIGRNDLRKNLAAAFKGQIAGPVIHPNATVSGNAKLKEGTVVMAGVVVNANAQIGRHCIINSGAVVEHDVVLGDFVHISPNAVVTGEVKIGEGTQIGAGASVIPGVKIGKWAVIGAGTVILSDVPDYAVVVGNPGQIIKYLNG